MARTAVVAGTATAVVGGMNRRQDAKAQAAADQQAAQQAAFEAQAQTAELQQQMAAMQAQQAAPAPAAPAAGGDDLNSQLERLSGLHQSGVLSDDEFAAAKAKLLGI
jgi:multidrug resistance efflux pump